jgi:hypothetical protein
MDRPGCPQASPPPPKTIGIGGKAGNNFTGYAVVADGGRVNFYNRTDAIFTAANYLCRRGATGGHLRLLRADARPHFRVAARRPGGRPGRQPRPVPLCPTETLPPLLTCGNGH